MRLQRATTWQARAGRRGTAVRRPRGMVLSCGIAAAGTARRGAILLEVLLSLALLLMGLAVVGLRVNMSLDTARRSNDWTVAVLLTESKMAELQAGAVRWKPDDEEVAGYFGIKYPGWSWRIDIEPSEIDNLYILALEVYYNALQVQDQISNPELEIAWDDSGAKLIRTVYRLMPAPADLDLNRDFGIDLPALEEQMSGGSGSTGETGGSGDANVNELWSMISEFLTQHPEILNANGGIDLQAVTDLPAEDFQMAMQILQQFVGKGNDFAALQEQLDQNLANEGGGRRGGGGRSGGGRR